MKKSFSLFLMGMVFIGANAQSVFAAPDEVLAHKAIPIWDYHKTNYDKDGNIRVKPTITTFYTGNKPVPSYDLIPRLETSDTDYEKDVKITFDISREEYKNWQAGIYKVTKVDPCIRKS